MNFYTSKYDLKNKSLKLGDHVLFSVKGDLFDYLVCRNHLSCALSSDDKIFITLNLDAIRFANQCYGYVPMCAEFPKCSMDDYRALTRVVIALFEECEKVNHATELEQTDMRYLF